MISAIFAIFRMPSDFARGFTLLGTLRGHGRSDNPFFPGSSYWALLVWRLTRLAAAWDDFQHGFPLPGCSVERLFFNSMLLLPRILGICLGNTALPFARLAELGPWQQGGVARRWLALVGVSAWTTRNGWETKTGKTLVVLTAACFSRCLASMRFCTISSASNLMTPM